MELKPLRQGSEPAGYKQTEVGVIPEEWEVKPLNRISPRQSVGLVINPSSYFDKAGTVPLLVGSNVGENFIDSTTSSRITKSSNELLSASRLVAGDLVTVRVGEPGVTAVVPPELDSCNCASMMIVRRHPSFDSHWLCAVMNSRLGRQQVEHVQYGTAQKQFNISDAVDFCYPVPPLPEQRAIAGALSDVDELIGSLDQLIVKKRDLKQAAMQQLLTGQTRLPAFSGKWEVKTLQESTDCLDSVRVPLNEAQRAQMNGDYPYCGANGVLDYVNGYVIDDDIILIAEDGGYFDEYERRPIAYRMSGKCWVNNHAHILKAKKGFDQGFLFYSLVHKNILRFLANGTRAKLNKSEMWKVEVNVPVALSEQTAIAEVLSDMDAELAALEQCRDKTRDLKQGMMQELLTGRTRLV